MADARRSELRSYDPTWQERIGGWLMGDERALSPRGRLVGALVGSAGLGSTGPGLMDFTPAGAVFAGQQAARDYSDGNYTGAAINGLGAVPGVAWAAAARPVRRAAASVAERVGDATSNLLGRGGNSAATAAIDGTENLALTKHMIYNPRPRPQRPFEADYPNGLPEGWVNESGQLARTIDGDPITARFVAGRREAGAADQGLSRRELDAVAEGITGSLPSPVAAKQIGGAYGRARVDRNGRPTDIFYDRSLTPQIADRVVGHEVGHVIEFQGRRGVERDRFSTEGLQADLRRNYHNLATDEHRGARTGPEHLGYDTRESQQRELVAEAIRGYATDPNAFKSQFPELAAWIRRNVNDNPNLNRIIQFNALTGLGVTGLLGASSDPSQASENPSNAVARDEVIRAAERAGMSPIDAMLFARRQAGQP